MMCGIQKTEPHEFFVLAKSAGPLPRYLFGYQSKVEFSAVTLRLNGNGCVDAIEPKDQWDWSDSLCWVNVHCYEGFFLRKFSKPCVKLATGF